VPQREEIREGIQRSNRYSWPAVPHREEIENRKVSGTFKPYLLNFKLNVRIIWVILLSLSLAGCIYMIYEVLYKYNNSPVVVSFATEDTPLHQIPFPAITICPEFKYSRQKFNFSEVYRKLAENEEVDDAE
jgi:hypothetical protein